MGWVAKGKGQKALTCRGEEGGWAGEFRAMCQGPKGPSARQAGDEVVPEIQLVGVALHELGERRRQPRLDPEAEMGGGCQAL